MGLKMSGYICDKCRKIILHPQNIPCELSGWINALKLEVRIYCTECGEIVKRAEEYMALKDAHLDDSEISA